MGRRKKAKARPAIIHQVKRVHKVKSTMPASSARSAPVRMQAVARRLSNTTSKSHTANSNPKPSPATEGTPIVLSSQTTTPIAQTRSRNVPKSSANTTNSIVNGNIASVAVNKENETSFPDLFTMLCRQSSDAVILFSADGWECKKCNVVEKLSSDSMRKLGDHLLQQHWTDTQGLNRESVLKERICRYCGLSWKKLGKHIEVKIFFSSDFYYSQFYDYV
jgi:hypothetical protein